MTQRNRTALLGRLVLTGLLLSLVDIAVASCSPAKNADPLSADPITVETARPYLALDGVEMDASAVVMTASGNRLSLAFTAPTAGKYQFGLCVEADQITPLAPGLSSFTADNVGSKRTYRYPYDWTYSAGKPGDNVLARSRAAMPGIQVGTAGTLYHIDTRELSAVILERSPADASKVRALLLFHSFKNSGGYDNASPEVRYTTGQSQTMDILTFSSMQQAALARNGAPNAIPGRNITPIYYKSWNRRFITTADYGAIATGFAGTFDWVIVRDANPDHSGVPAQFHAKNIKCVDYQYIGALRRDSPQVDNGEEQTLGMLGSDGALYTAPAPGGNWVLTDIRNPQVRAVHVANAVKAVTDGFDGVYLDGYAFHRDGNCRIGGDYPAAAMSWAKARYLLLTEIRDAIRAVNPAAILGILDNRYYDYMGVADFIVKERMYSMWTDGEDGKAVDYKDRTVYIQENLDTAFEEGEAPFSNMYIMYGAQGISPVSVNSVIHFVHTPRGPRYITTEDFPLPSASAPLSDWIAVQRDAAAKSDLYIKRIATNKGQVHFIGAGTIWSPAACTVEFSIPTRVAVSGNAFTGSKITTLNMQANVKYDVEIP